VKSKLTHMIFICEFEGVTTNELMIDLYFEMALFLCDQHHYYNYNSAVLNASNESIISN